MNHQPLSIRPVITIIVIAFSFVKSVDLQAQELPRIGRVVSPTVAAYFGLNRQDVSFDSARVKSMTPLTIEHMIDGRVIEARTFAPREQDAFLRYLRDYESLLIAVPDPFLADSTLRPVLRYAQPIKSYVAEPSTIGVRTKTGSVIEGLLVAASPSIVAVSRYRSADSVSKAMAVKGTIDFISIVQIDSVWFHERRDKAQMVDGSATTLSDIFNRVDPLEMYESILPPELEEMMSTTKLRATQIRRTISPSYRQQRTGVMIYGGTALTSQASDVVTEAFYRSWDNRWRSSIAESQVQESAYMIGASTQFYLSQIFDVGIDVSASIQPTTSAADEPNSGFDAYSARFMFSYVLLPRQIYHMPGIEIALRAGVGASYMQYRLRGRIATQSLGYIAFDEHSSLNLTMSLGVAPTVVITDNVDIVLGFDYRAILGPSYVSPQALYRFEGSTSVGSYMLEMESTTVTLLDFSLGLRFWL